MNQTNSSGASPFERPSATALVRGSREYPAIEGRVDFYQTPRGVVVSAEVSGLPAPAGACESPVFAFHIHEGTSCTGNAEDPFANALSHDNPGGCQHPHHAGDMPPLFGNDGYAFSAFLTNRFTVKEVFGRVVIIHAGVDDFTTQPAGNAGAKIACGVIQAV